VAQPRPPKEIEGKADSVREVDSSYVSYRFIESPGVAIGLFSIDDRTFTSFVSVTGVYQKNRWGGGLTIRTGREDAESIDNREGKITTEGSYFEIGPTLFYSPFNVRTLSTYIMTTPSYVNKSITKRRSSSHGRLLEDSKKGMALSVESGIIYAPISFVGFGFALTGTAGTTSSWFGMAFTIHLGSIPPWPEGKD